MARLFDFMYLVPSQLYHSSRTGATSVEPSGIDSSGSPPSDEGEGGSPGSGETGVDPQHPLLPPPPSPLVGPPSRTVSNPPPLLSPSAGTERTARSQAKKGENEKHTFGAAKSRNLAHHGVPGNALSAATKKKKKVAVQAAARKNWGSSLDQQSRLQQLTASRLSQLRGTDTLTKRKGRRQQQSGDQEREIIHQLRSLYQKELDASRRKRGSS
jgi:hypothetical protein